MASIFNILDLSVYGLCWGYQEPYCVASKDEVTSVCGSSAVHSSIFADIVGIVHESLCDQCERIALGSNCGHFCFLLLSAQTHSPHANSSPTSLLSYQARRPSTPSYLFSVRSHVTHRRTFECTIFMYVSSQEERIRVQIRTNFLRP